MDYENEHPECLPDETFLGNANAGSFASCGWKTKRLGIVAYDIDGNVLPESIPVRPLFAKTAESPFLARRSSGKVA